MGHSSSSTSILLIFNLLFLFFSISTSSTATAADLRLELEAKKLVRDLNLFPDVKLNIAAADAANSSSSLDPHGKIVEKRLKFPNLVNDDGDDVSVEDFGHYAGYYPIQHSHAARCFLSSRFSHTYRFVISMCNICNFCVILFPFIKILSIINNIDLL
jgi:serine carboxypeptidase-like clade 4